MDLVWPAKIGSVKALEPFRNSLFRIDVILVDHREVLSHTGQIGFVSVRISLFLFTVFGVLSFFFFLS